MIVVAPAGAAPAARSPSRARRPGTCPLARARPPVSAVRGALQAATGLGRLAPVLVEAKEQLQGPALRVVHLFHGGRHAAHDPREATVLGSGLGRSHVGCSSRSPAGFPAVTKASP